MKGKIIDLSKLSHKEQNEMFKYHTKRLNADKVKNQLRSKLRSRINQIKEIKEEGISVIEYALKKEDLPRLNNEVKELKQFIGDIDVLAGYYEIIKKNMGKKFKQTNKPTKKNEHIHTKS